MSNTHARIAWTIQDIDEQATRHRRAATDYELLINDLEIIERKVIELRALLPKCVTPTGLTDAHGTYVKITGPPGKRRRVCSFCDEPIDEPINELIDENGANK